MLFDRKWMEWYTELVAAWSVASDPPVAGHADAGCWQEN